ncbi:MAG TPA: NmrA/HSCARG family protein [Chloroflexaceae bacterium]|nr:NmrA/HSCARG family protein [Chloroflexaceae bacterium]
MAAAGGRIIVVTGATGLQGGAVARHLLDHGWRVRALTRNPASKGARALAARGAELVRGDMGDPASLRPAFAGAYGVFSVQNPVISGPEAEVRQGKHVADVARDSGAQHLVYGSAGVGRPGTGIPSWETKLQIEEHLRALALPLTILRPMAFMELMTEQRFFPAAAIWHVMREVIGASRPVAWLCTDDLGAIVARVFAAPERFAGRELALASDVQSLAECRAIYRDVMGKDPPRLPMPVWLFRRFGFVGRDLIAMWRWLRAETIDLDVAPTRAILPEALTVRDWLSRRRPARG